MKLEEEQKIESAKIWAENLDDSLIQSACGVIPLRADCLPSFQWCRQIGDLSTFGCQVYERVDNVTFSAMTAASTRTTKGFEMMPWKQMMSLQ